MLTNHDDIRWPCLSTLKKEDANISSLIIKFIIGFWWIFKLDQWNIWSSEVAIWALEFSFWHYYYYFFNFLIYSFLLHIILLRLAISSLSMLVNLIFSKISSFNWNVHTLPKWIIIPPIVFKFDRFLKESIFLLYW